MIKTTTICASLLCSIFSLVSKPPFPRPPVRPNGSFRGLPQKANSYSSFPQIRQPMTNLTTNYLLKQVGAVSNSNN